MCTSACSFFVCESLRATVSRQSCVFAFSPLNLHNLPPPLYCQVTVTCMRQKTQKIRVNEFHHHKHSTVVSRRAQVSHRIVASHKHTTDTQHIPQNHPPTHCLEITIFNPPCLLFSASVRVRFCAAKRDARLSSA